jgi:formate dehydrogenase major subunit
MKRRLRGGAHLIVIDPRAIALVKSPHVEADYHLRLRPGTNVAIINALAHVVVTEGLTRDDYVSERCERDSYEKWKKFVADPVNSPEAMEKVTGVKAELIRGAARLYAEGPNSAIYYGLGVREHSQGTTMVMGIANRDGHGQPGARGVGVSPLRGQNNVQGSCDMGSFPHEFSDTVTCLTMPPARCSNPCGRCTWSASPGCAFPTCSKRRSMARSVGCPGRGHAVRSNTAHVTAALCDGMHRDQDILPTKRRSTRTCSCRARRSWRRTARSPMPSGAFRACARSSSRWADMPTGSHDAAVERTRLPHGL